MTDISEKQTSADRPSAGRPSAERISADQIAATLGHHAPTAQQRAVIESPLGPALVVAGAGSGKTETMAARVLWLVANGHVAPSEILGLTFTRKAAGELGERVRRRLGELAEFGLIPGEPDPFETPTIATYNSFANTIYRDNALLLGREPDGDVLGEASAWQLARKIVTQSDDARLGRLGKSVDAITKAVIDVSHGLVENIADSEVVARMAEDFAAVEQLPLGSRWEYGDVMKQVASVAALPVLIDLSGEFARAKAARGHVEYSDQVALALELVRRVPRIAEELRGRYRVVLLDEYQDTSVVQTWLLSQLFADHAVMAVGDPHQSIYGWRGASSANLEDFAAQFGRSAALPVQQYSLSTSWRNGIHILAAANVVVAPLTAETRVRVEQLTAAPTASSHAVESAFVEDLAAEADTVARWLSARLSEPLPGREAEERPTAAMLFRTRRTQRAFIEALRVHQVPFHVLGVGGLMEEPEIADLVSALTVLTDPSAGSELIRLLAGPRWHIGVRDLHSLKGIASTLGRRDFAQRRLDEEVVQRMRDSVAEDESASLVDALDFIATAKPGHSLLASISETGLDRMRDAGVLLARLRTRTGLDLLDFVTMCEQELMIDIEVAANPDRVQGRAPLDAFYDALSNYIAVDDSPTIRSFLSWLREAEWRDNLAPRPEEPEAGVVQLMTIHGSKGLERDIIVVPRMVAGELPGTPIEGTGAWLGFGRLPWEFRGDSAELPQLDWRAATSRKELVDAVKVFKGEVAEHQEREERRLAYVAITRARHRLLLTGSFWAGQSKPRRASPYLLALAEHGVVPAPPEGPENDSDPGTVDDLAFVWPEDPLGHRRPLVYEAAARVISARQSRATGHSGDEGRWASDIELLLKERHARGQQGAAGDIPVRVPASRFKDYVTDPGAVAADLRRPMPEKPYRATRLGTLFHEWVEQRYGVHGSLEEIDSFPEEIDADADRADLTQEQQLDALRRTFETSRWAGVTPVEVEREIHLPLAGKIIICKIDAVYEAPAGPDGSPRFEVVDWKTGRAPRDPAELEDRQLQLALYRQAYAEWKGIDPTRIDAVFYYVADDAIIRPERIFDRDELERLWRESQQ